MSGSKITIGDGDDRLANVHPGEILREDFLIGSEVPVDEVAAGSGVPRDIIERLIRCETAVDAETGLRLARYFGMSEGFFLGLQLDYDVEEARDLNRDALDRIVRRAA